MDYNIANIINGHENILDINTEVTFPNEYFTISSIKKMNKTVFNGEISKINDELLNINGLLKGSMVLLDDLSLSEVNYPFEIEIDEDFGINTDNLENNLKIIQNRLDIIPFLWQNIVLEVPTKIISETSHNIKTEGDGWKLINEEELNNKN